MPGLCIVSTSEALGCLFLDNGFVFRLGLRTAARSFGERRFDLLDRFGLGNPLHGRDFARQPVERRFIELTLGIGLLRLRLRTIEIANDFAMATISPELILASYSCARRDHMVRLIRARPLSVSSARLTSGVSASLRMPTDVTFDVGTRSVILSLTKLMTNSSSRAPATSCSSIEMIWPTPCAG